VGGDLGGLKLIYARVLMNCCTLKDVRLLAEVREQGTVGRIRVFGHKINLILTYARGL
jgi:hypothetical protein